MTGMTALFCAHLACWTMNIALFSVPVCTSVLTTNTPTCITTNTTDICLTASKTPLLCLAKTFSHQHAALYASLPVKAAELNRSALHRSDFFHSQGGTVDSRSEY